MNNEVVLYPCRYVVITDNGSGSLITSWHKSESEARTQAFSDAESGMKSWVAQTIAACLPTVAT